MSNNSNNSSDKATSNDAVGNPRRRGRKPTELECPEDDTVERKRVLNILAQRRYSMQDMPISLL